MGTQLGCVPEIAAVSQRNDDRDSALFGRIQVSTLYIEHNERRTDTIELKGAPMKKRSFLLLCIVLLLFLVTSAQAETVSLSRLPLESSDPLTPVLAPFDDALPASLPVLLPEEEPELEILGRVAVEDDWWFVSVEDEEETERYAWIRVRTTPPEEREEKPSELWVKSWSDYRNYDWEGFDDDGVFHTECLSKSAVLMTLTEPVQVLEAPSLTAPVLRELPEGAQVRRLVLWDEDVFLYILTEAEGQPACGFIPAESAEPVTLAHINQSELIVHEGVEFLGCLLAEDSSGYDYYYRGPVYAAQDFGMVCLFDDELMNIISGSYQELLGDDYDDVTMYDIYDPIRTVSLPSTLRLMGDNALSWMRLEELTLPEGLKQTQGIHSMDRLTVGTLHIPSTLCNDFHLNMHNCRIGAFDVSEGNPYLKSVDGVLFSRDGTVLKAYPDIRDKTHYDVPKGTEVIGFRAFYLVEDMWEFSEPGVQLQTISLPLGLKKIESYAFGGCVNLISITIPPTVTEIAPTAFCNPVSLGRISLPEGFSVEDLYQDYVRPDDQSRFNGDNGAAITEKEDRW